MNFWKKEGPLWTNPPKGGTKIGIKPKKKWKRDKMRRKAQCKENGKLGMSEIGCLKRVCA